MKMGVSVFVLGVQRTGILQKNHKHVVLLGDVNFQENVYPP